MKPFDSVKMSAMAEEERGGELVRADCGLVSGQPNLLDLLPMAELNIFPQLVYPISVEDSRVKDAVQRCLETGRPMALFAVRDAGADPYALRQEDFHPIGLAVLVHKVWDTENGNLRVVVQGLSRIKLLSLAGGNQEMASVETVADEAADAGQLRPLVLEARKLFAEVAEKIPALPFNPIQFGPGLDEKPGLLADLMMAALPVKTSAKAEFLGILDVKERLLKLMEHLTVELENLKVGQAIAQRVKDGIDKRHREMHLREQLKAIEAELGEDEADGGDELKELGERLAAKDLTPEARETAEREFKRLKKTSSQSAEYGVIRNYLELILDLPWKDSTFDKYDLALAREILERDHYGLEKVKKRIVEYLAVRKLTGGIKSPILCLVGPPGVGKTSLGRSVAEALGREFVRLSLGGVRDEAEIRGHRRTYVGAMAGRIIGGLKKAKSNNPVFLLDELDKMTQNMMGDPAAALLEVLDPEQNSTFSDHYLEIPFDLSNVLFIMTANVMESIPGPLRDRMELVELSGYTLEEKSRIARRHLLPREMERHGLEEGDLTLTDQALNDLIDAYTREAGVRDLTRRLGAIARSAAVEKAEGRATGRLVDQEDLPAILGPPRHQKEIKALQPQVGVVTGLAWTAAGGDILFIEAVAMPGKGQVSLTGQLGEVMRESAGAAISYVRSRAEEWNLDAGWFQNHDLHLHLPQGAIPKDGPSAGVTLATAIVSLIRGRKVKADVAMTGEISLRGLVLPVGGIKEKLLAAKRAGLSRVLIPEKNLADLKEMPEHLLKGMTVTTVKTLDEVLDLALEDAVDWDTIALCRKDEPILPGFQGDIPSVSGGLSLAGDYWSRVTIAA
ncbi:endopeptidase La [Deltaproteobacteria bacterium OttesenSCG-928-K17]|nr:endopeptidase La [Deltaproteobacteria bacterium OttesenSCG-928-K17]